jgi:hypothetical protein
MCYGDGGSRLFTAAGPRDWWLLCTGQSLFSPQGTFGQFDVQSSTHAWLLAPDAGLWHTTDGTTWRPVGGTAT